MSRRLLTQQVIPIGLTVVILSLLGLILWGEIVLLNRYTLQHIIVEIRWGDVIVGLTIYLKTSIDFAMFMGNLMRANPGWRNRVAIEIGTAVGNALGTLAILAVWAFFKEIKILLATMVLLASLVLFQLAQDGLDHARISTGAPWWYTRLLKAIDTLLRPVNNFFSPVLSRLIPHLSMKTAPAGSWRQLFSLSFTIPFVLGLDDFAGYVPLFSVVNVFGFALGVMAGHMILNVFLFFSPSRTIAAVKNPFISFAGAVAFIGLAVWGISEALHLLW